MNNITVPAGHGAPLAIIDNGHGCDTSGKRSPDGSHREWEWTRRAARRLKTAAEKHGIETALLVPEAADVPLRERCRRADAMAEGRDAILISLHNNAAGDGSVWHSARGFSAFIAPRASESSARFARTITSLAAARGLSGNRATAPEGFLRGNFAIVRDTAMPAVLTENLFMDNRGDAAMLASEEGMVAIVRLHLDALLIYFNIPQ